MTGRMFDERLGKIHFWLTFISFNATFAPDAPHRRPGHAAARGRLRGAVRRLEPVHLAVSSFVLGALDARVRLQHGRELARRAARPREPVARAHAGVAGVLAAADLQLRPACRPWSAARTSTACPARCTGSSSRAAEAGQDSPRGRSAPMSRGASRCRTSLSSRTRRIGGKALLDAMLRARAEKGDVQLLRRGARRRGPATATSSTTTSVRDCRAGAHRPRARVHAATRASQVAGEVGDPDPFNAAMDAVREHEHRRDHRLHPARSRSGWLRRDLPERLRGGDRAAGRARRRRPRGRGPAVRRHARGGQPDRRRARAGRAAEGAGRRGRRTASSSSSRRTAATATPSRGARAPDGGCWTRCARPGIVAAGHDRRPRSLHGGDERACSYFHISRDRHLDAARGLLAVGGRQAGRARRRARPNKPVEHIESAARRRREA